MTEQGERAPVWVIFAGLMLAMLIAALDSTIVATALPTIVDDLGGLEHISWVTSSHLLAQTAVTPLYGKIGDLHARELAEYQVVAARRELLAELVAGDRGEAVARRPEVDDPLRRVARELLGEVP